MADAVDEIYGPDSTMGEFATLLRKVDNTFDVFNSSSEGKDGQTKPRKCGYGKNHELQEATLIDFCSYVVQLRILNKTNLDRIAKGQQKISLQPWQKGFVICCISLMELSDDLRTEYQITWFPTTAVNQDCVECLFSILRALGGNNYRFGALSYVWRLRLVVLGAGQNLKLYNANVKQDQSEKLFTVNLAQNLLEPPEVPNVVETENNWIDAIDDSSISAFVMAVPEEDTLAEVDAIKAEDIPDSDGSDSDSDDADDDINPCQSQKRGRTPKKSTKKPKNSKLEFNEPEVYDPVEWISKRRSKIIGEDLEALVGDIEKWNEAFLKYHEPAHDGQCSILRTPQVIGNFVKVIADLNPNKFHDKVLRLFAMDRTLHRMHHMKVQLRSHLRDKNRKESSRSKNLKNHLAE